MTSGQPGAACQRRARPASSGLHLRVVTVRQSASQASAKLYPAQRARPVSTSVPVRRNERLLPRHNPSSSIVHRRHWRSEDETLSTRQQYMPQTAALHGADHHHTLSLHLPHFTTPDSSETRVQETLPPSLLYPTRITYHGRHVETRHHERCDEAQAVQEPQRYAASHPSVSTPPYLRRDKRYVPHAYSA